ncbi:N-carbamoyl-D-amino acid hydrolase [Botrimarina colliarenosi]|uniref:N-carbamoyl-D-amino acid hydrolase n=1 Tax=Botrimarina colliarenosi TaxID=2528001 RepID=A0A5C6ADZ6_9BACT|nr:carbon-nitrogen hydrolase [Botrimarina colliarenosi]TWT98194.1 N-carbamoyl-D-amino acid hydrolase [Botrimarina colliarenosi]
MPPITSVRVALVQMNCSGARETVRDRAEAHVRQAVSDGAQIVCLQEVFDATYFPQQVATERYALAEPLPSPTTERFGRLAGELGVVLIVPVYEEAQPGVYFNSVVVFDADGRDLGKYRKTHIPDGPQYHEKFYFTPGDLGYKTFATRFGPIGVAICWDEWFPEVARIMALQGAQILFYPSAIGSEPDRPGYSSAEAWRTVIRSHGIANGVFVAAVNRVGTEEAMTFYGESFVSDPLGEVLAQADSAEQVLLADLPLGRVREARELLHFLRDRRIDTYEPLLKRTIE